MLHRHSRRSFLLGVGVAAAVASIAPALPGVAAAPYDGLRARRREFLTGGSVAATHAGLASKRAAMDTTIAGYLATFNRASGRTYLWPGMVVGSASTTDQVANLGLTANRLTELATAWASAGSDYYGDASLLADVTGGLAFLAGQYRADRTRPGNWWYWEIGIPRQVGDTLILLDGQVSTDTKNRLLAAVRYHAPNPNVRYGSTLKESGANRSDKALACLLRGLIGENSSELVLGRDALSDVAGGGANSMFSTVTSGDGFYVDGSFVQHSYLPYSGTYGGVAINGVSQALSLLAGSTWQVTDPDLDNLFDAVEKTFAPFQWDVRAMDATRGRAVSRQREADFDSGFAIASAILLLAESASSTQRSTFRSLVKGWLQRTTDQSVATNRQRLADSARSLALLNDSAVTASAARVGTTNTYSQERVVHHRGSWAAVANTSSARIGRYEWGNNENNTGWYQGDGMLFVYHRGDLGQYSNDFWPTVDPYALPGITANTQTRSNGPASGTAVPRASNTYAGGLTLGGVVGTTAMDLRNATNTLTANKSWFYLADSVVCVGTKIADTSGTSVRTIVENRSFAVGSIPAVRLDKQAKTLSSTAVSARIAHIAGHAGIVSLPTPGRSAQAFSVRSERRTGTWGAINIGGDTGGDSVTRTRDYVRIEQAHASSGGWYAYQVLPQASSGTTEATPSVEVLLATDNAHVLDVGNDTVLAHFFASGTHAGYTVSGACAVGHRESGGRLEVVVSQPTKAGGTITVDLPFDAPGSVVSKDSTVTVSRTSPLRLTVDAGPRRGGEHRVTFNA